MRVKTLVLVMIAMVCGLLATIGISQVIDRQNQNKVAAETVKVFVAGTDIDIGAALNSQNVRLEEWPKDRVPDGAILKLEDLENRFARQRLFPGEPILNVKLMDSNADTTLTIPEGYRACSIKVSGEVVVGNLVKPGDRVDVIVFLRRGGDVPLTGTRTILRDVRVWAVNSRTERSVDDQGQVNLAQTVSLLVTPKQVEVLTLASELGQLRLSLRRPNDGQETDDSGTDVDSFLTDGSAPKNLTEGPTKPETPAPSLLNLLDQMKRAPAVLPTTPEPVLPVSNSVRFSMMVHTPQGLVRYDWLEGSDVPQVVSLSGNAAPLGPPVSVPPPAVTPPVAAPVPPPTGSASPSEIDDKMGSNINVP